MNGHIRSILFALSWLAIGITVSGWAFHRIKEEKLSQENGPLFEREHAAYSILQKGICIGFGTTDYKHTEDGFSLFISGTVHGAEEAPITGELSFNHLGQLMGSIFDVKGAEGYFRFGSTGVDPILVKIRGQVWSKDIDISVPFAGPLELVPEGNKLRLVDTRGSFNSFASASNIDSSEFEIVKGSSEESCTKRGTIQLPQLFQPLLNFRQGVQ